MAEHEEDIWTQPESPLSGSQRRSIDDIISQSTTIPTSLSDGPLTIASANSTEYQQDRYMFRNVGKRFKEHVKKFGEGLHFGGLFSPKSGHSSEEDASRRSEFELEAIPADEFEDITRLIWSAFRVPFNVFTTSAQGCIPVPVILSLIKVPRKCCISKFYLL